jgi:hypothetical protein
MTETVGDLAAPEATPTRRRPWSAIGLTAMAALATAVSLSRPLSFDEMYWLTMARRIFGAGDLPYIDLLDNKGPLLYAVFGLFDAVPLPERGTLTALFVVVAVALAAGVWRLAGSRGQTRGWRYFSSALVTIVMMTLSVWAVTTELLASALLVWAFAISHPWMKVACVLAACLIDPRAALFAPIVLLDGRQRRDIDVRHIVVFGGLAAVAVATVMAVPDFRYAFIETSFATRFEANSRDVALVSAAALMPLLVMGTVRLQRIPLVAIAVGAVAVLIGIAAGLPLGHYWVYVVLVVPLLPITGPRVSVTVTVVTALLSIAAVVLATRDHFAFDVDQAAQQEPVAAGIEELTEPDDRVLVWASSPHLRYRIAPQTLGFAPTSNYFAWGLPDESRLLDRLAEDLGRATVVVVDPGLEAYRGFPQVAAALDQVAEHIAGAECSSVVSGVAVYRFEGC